MTPYGVGMILLELGFAGASLAHCSQDAYKAPLFARACVDIHNRIRQL